MCKHEPVYIKTDKNGTKYYADYTCTRCGGKGYWEGWRYTGLTCYKCGGTGVQDKPEIIKEYTPEYEAKLEAQRAKRAEKRRQERVEEINNNLSEMLQAKNFNADGKQYVVVQENSYDIREELKGAGAWWNGRLSHWVFANKPEAYKTVEVDWQEYMEVDYEQGWLRYRDDVNHKELIESKLPKKVSTSQYVGNVKDKIETEVKLERVFTYYVEAHGWFHHNQTEERYIYSFTDKDGNVLVWKTASCEMFNCKGETFRIKGTVKSHDEYKGTKQTQLQRVKRVA